MTDEPVLGTTYPIVFKIQIPVQGTDFNAGVEFSGGAVVLLEEDGFLAHGLKPGGVAGVGDTLVEAYLDLRQKIELALYDIAEMVADYSAFKRKVRRFFHDADPWAEETFEAARKRVAKGEVTYDLPMKPNPAFRHRVRLFEASLPKNNPKPGDVGLASLPRAA